MGARAIPAAAQLGTGAKAVFRHPLAGSALLTETEWAATAGVLRLSGRELQIVRGVFDNRKETALAAELGIAPRTVDTHMERLYRKLTVTTRVALVLRVMAVLLEAKARPAAGNGLTTTIPVAPSPGCVG